MKLKLNIVDPVTYQEELYVAELRDEYLSRIFESIEYLKRNPTNVVEIYFEEIEDILYKTNKFHRDGEVHYAFTPEKYNNVLKAVEIFLDKMGYTIMKKQYSVLIFNTLEYCSHKGK